MKNVKQNRTSKPPATNGRPGQRNRTRAAIVDAAMRLMSAEKTPSMAEVAAEAQVSRRTIYMYFPTLEQLLIDATLGALSRETVDAVTAEFASTDPVVRAEQLSRAINNHSADTMHLGRALIRLTVEGEQSASGGPRRGYRRVQWIEQAIAPAREKLTRDEFEQLVSALSVLIGWEPMIALQDVRALDQKQADDVLAFAVRAVVEKSLGEAGARRKSTALSQSRNRPTE